MNYKFCSPSYVKDSPESESSLVQKDSTLEKNNFTRQLTGYNRDKFCRAIVLRIVV